MAKSPYLYIIAGPNGSGKATLVRRFLPYYADCINFVNTDLMAAGLSPFSPDIAVHKIEKNWIPDQVRKNKKGGRFFTKSSTMGR